MTDEIDIYDAESVYERPADPGPPVDPPNSRRTLYATVTSRESEVRRPIVPAALRNRQQRRTLTRWAVRYSGHTAAYHATRTPKYAAKVAVWAPVGVLRTIGRAVRWAMAEEGNWSLRQSAANRDDADTWLKLDKQRQRESSWRWWVVGAGTLAVVAVVTLLLSDLTPDSARWAVAAAAVVVFARLGRPADRPIVDRVTAGPVYRKLTAELVRRAVLACNVPGIKDAAQLVFPQDIHRDGPGHRAVVDLPYGVEATEVIERRGRLASALRLPLDQVWPETAPGHTGRLALWVGDEPASTMRQPAWPLLRAGAVDLFGEFPFATDPQLRPVTAQMMYRNWLFGGVPGSGKTFALRLLVLAAALDTRAELRGYELKGTGDYDVAEPVLTEYGSGADDATVEAAYRLLVWLRSECGRRAERVKHFARAGKAPENKVTPELAGLPGSGLHPLVAFVDECQELFTDDEYGKTAGKLAEQIIKLGRAYGVILLLGTQRPDAKSLPTGITANVNTRFCLAVMDQTANDMILGTSAYKNGYRATHFEPGRDAGWGWAVGLGRPAPMRSYYLDGPGAKRVIERAIELRGGPVDVDTVTPRERIQVRNLLADVRAVWIEGEQALWSELLVPRLVRLDPQAYGDLTVETFGARMRAAGVATVSIHRKIDGKGYTRAGVRLAELESGIKARAEILADSGTRAIDSPTASPSRRR